MKEFPTVRLSVINTVANLLIDLAIDGDDSQKTDELEDNMRMVADAIIDALGMEVVEATNGIAVVNIKID